MKRTELKPGKPLKRSPMRPRVRRPLRQRSKKMAKLYREVRGPLVAEILAERPWCERGKYIVENFLFQPAHIRDFWQIHRSVVVHEKLTRARGGSITDKANAVALCGDCHSWIHLHPKQATEDGWLVSGKKKIGPMNTQLKFSNSSIPVGWSSVLGGDATNLLAVTCPVGSG